MERLTKKDFNFTTDFIKRDIDSWSIAQCLKKLQEYEDVEEQGLLLRLKCKTRDTVYYRTNNNDIYPIKINEINILNSDVIYNGYFMKCTYEFDNSDFGKTVFLTKSEAEQKLKEMNDNYGITE